MEANRLSTKYLMVGDWVIPHVYDSKLEPSKIVGIHYNSYKGKDYVDWVDCEVWDELSLSDIEPIPLTPEILEKNGFVVESRNCHGNPLQYCVLVDGLWIDISGENYFESKLKYVHQLQHALRLCEIEKEITL